MKILRIAAIVMAVLMSLTIAASAVEFTPSVERKDGPEIIEGDDDLIITPIAHLHDEDIELHEDIVESLTDAKEKLDDSEWHEIVKDFEELWAEYTKGAPIEHAVVSDIFDVRYESELGTDAEKGKTVTFKIKLQGITADDFFLVITESYSDHHMEIVAHEISADGVITITATSMAAFAIVRDNCITPPCDHDSPQTGVMPYCVPAVIGIVVFGALAAFCAVKIKKVSAN